MSIPHFQHLVKLMAARTLSAVAALALLMGASAIRDTTEEQGGDKKKSNSSAMVSCDKGCCEDENYGTWGKIRPGLGVLEVTGGFCVKGKYDGPCCLWSKETHDKSKIGDTGIPTTWSKVKKNIGKTDTSVQSDGCGADLTEAGIYNENVNIPSRTNRCCGDRDHQFLIDEMTTDTKVGKMQPKWQAKTERRRNWCCSDQIKLGYSGLKVYATCL